MYHNDLFAPVVLGNALRAFGASGQWTISAFQKMPNRSCHQTDQKRGTEVCPMANHVPDTSCKQLMRATCCKFPERETTY